jgi:hypothetical protein
MSNENIIENQNKASNVVEDLTLSETDAQSIKGGAVDMFLKLDGVKGEAGDHKREY